MPRKAIKIPEANKNAQSRSILELQTCFSAGLLAVATFSEAAGGNPPSCLIRLRDATSSKQVCLQSVAFVAITEALPI